MMSLKFLKGLNIENNVLKLYQFNKVVYRIISSWNEFKVTIILLGNKPFVLNQFIISLSL